MYDQNNAVHTNWYHNSACHKLIIVNKESMKCIILKMQLISHSKYHIHLMTMQLISHGRELTLQLST